MPPKIEDNTSAPTTRRGSRGSRRQGPVDEAGHNHPSPPHSMATQTQSPGYWCPVPTQDVPDRVRLPPLLPSPNTTTVPRPLPLSALMSPVAPDPSPRGISNDPHTPPSTRSGQQEYFPPQERPYPTQIPHFSPVGSSNQPEPSNPLKRPYPGYPYSVRPPPPLTVVTPSSSENRETFTRNILPPSSAQSSLSNVSTPTGTSASFPLPGHTSTFSRPPSEVSSNAITHRCSLHIRQQPRAARAGPDGKDRRNVDPPPVLQLMMTDFDPDSPADLSELKSNHYVVHCKLISAESPRIDVTTHTTVSEDGSRETSRLLLGTNVASPFFCADDPDVNNMPQHPKLAATEAEPPDSPSSRFFPSRRSTPPSTSSTNPPRSLPAAFFIFADLSVRRAGSYRLEFTLMKIDPTAQNLPMIHVAASNVFRVVNAKDFDQVHPSTSLVRGLLERGAPFPLKLKKGIREGQRRRTTLEGDGDEEGSVEAGAEDDEGEE